MDVTANTPDTPDIEPPAADTPDVDLATPEASNAPDVELPAADTPDIDLAQEAPDTPDIDLAQEAPDIDLATPEAPDMPDADVTANAPDAPDVDLTNEAPDIDLTSDAPDIDLTEDSAAVANDPILEPTVNDQAGPTSSIVQTVEPVPAQTETSSVPTSSAGTTVAGMAAGAATGAAVGAQAKPSLFGRLFSQRGGSEPTPGDQPDVDGDRSVFSSETAADPSADSDLESVEAAADSGTEASNLSPGTPPVPDQNTERDDLTRISTITPALEIFLHNQDLWTYRQMGSLSDADIDRLQDQLPEHPGIVREEDWVGQARRLYNEKFN